MPAPLASLLCVALTAPAAGTAMDLAAPVRVEAGDRPIDTKIGPAHPLVGDGDGVRDPLGGQFSGKSP